MLFTDPTPIVYIHTTGMAHFRILEYLHVYCLLEGHHFFSSVLFVSAAGWPGDTCIALLAGNERMI